MVFLSRDGGAHITYRGFLIKLFKLYKLLVNSSYETIFCSSVTYKILNKNLAGPKHDLNLLEVLKPFTYHKVRKLSLCYFYFVSETTIFILSRSILILRVILSLVESYVPLIVYVAPFSPTFYYRALTCSAVPVRKEQMTVLSQHLARRGGPDNQN
jgi:hypothetical protein